MVREHKVAARDGSTLTLQVDTICVHGDTPDAAALAAAVRMGLEQAGITVAALKIKGFDCGHFRLSREACAATIFHRSGGRNRTSVRIRGVR